MFFSYIKERMIEDRETILRLLFLDEEIQGFSENYQKFLGFLSKKPSVLHENRKIDDIYILEGKAKDFVLILNDTMNEYKEIIVEETNLGFNKWLYKIYNEYCDMNEINRANVTFSNHYQLEKGRVILVGSSAFCKELKSCLKIPSIEIETN